MKNKIASVIGAFLLFGTSISWADPPSESGIVTRFVAENGAIVGIVFYWPPTDQTYAIGVGIEEFCAEDFARAFALSFVDIQRLDINVDRTAGFFRGEVLARVYEGDEVDNLFNCAAEPAAYEGTVRWRETDNHLPWADACPVSSPSNANAWGFVFAGKVTHTTWETVHKLSATARWVWNSCDDLAAPPTVARVNFN